MKDVQYHNKQPFKWKITATSPKFNERPLHSCDTWRGTIFLSVSGDILQMTDLSSEDWRDRKRP